MVKFILTYFQKILTGLLLITIPCILFAFPDIAISDEQKRLLIGIDLFPSFLASDQNIRNKKGRDNQLNIVILYQYDKTTADNMAQRLNSLGKIRGTPIKVIASSVYDLEHSKNQTIAGIFIAESMIPLESIINKSIDNNFIIFSPFEGDVEKGATGGIYITERIVPYINMITLRRAKIEMKSFFLRVSKKYD